MKGINFHELCDFVEMTKNRAIDYRFIEFMPFSMNDWDEKRMVPYKEAVQEIVKVHPNFGPCDNHDTNSTSKVIIQVVQKFCVYFLPYLPKALMYCYY